MFCRLSLILHFTRHRFYDRLLQGGNCSLISAERLLRLLRRALALLAPGGRCVYSTCSLSPIEGEAVVAAALAAAREGGGRYELRLYNATAHAIRTPGATAARFLTQATFGATSSEIRTITGASLEETERRIEHWVQEQMGMQPTLHRVYLRKRTNPSMRNYHHLMMRCVY